MRVGWGCQGRRMGDKRVIMRAAWFGSCRRIAILAAVSFAAGSGILAAPASSKSFGDRFKSLLGLKPEHPAEAAAPGEGETDLTCPPVSIRAGASPSAVAAPGKQPVGNDLRVQATITRTARDCTKNGDQITARIGIQGRVIAGPAGAPSSLEIPLRVAVVQGGVQEKTIATKVYRTTVAISEDCNVPFARLSQDRAYPVPPGAAPDSYIFYISFAPQALKPQPTRQPETQY